MRVAYVERAVARGRATAPGEGAYRDSARGDGCRGTGVRGTEPGYYGYLALYNLAYVFDDALMVTIAVVTLGQRRLQERGGRWLELLFAPELLVF